MLEFFLLSLSVFNHTYGSDTDRRVRVAIFFLLFLSSRHFCQCIVKTGQRTHQETKDLFIVISLRRRLLPSVPLVACRFQ